MELRHLDINSNKYFYIFKEGRRIYVKNNKLTKPLNTKLNAIELLQQIQEKYNYISEENLIKLSQNQNIPLIQLTGIVTFYKNFKLKPQGKHKIKLCNGTACNIKRSPELLKYIEHLLKIKPNETTKDNLFSLEIVNCIGACARAPAMMLNDEIYGNLTKEKIERLLERLK